VPNRTILLPYSIGSENYAEFKAFNLINWLLLLR